MATIMKHIISMLLFCFALDAVTTQTIDILRQHDKFSMKYFQEVAASNPSETNVVTSAAAVYKLLALLYFGSSKKSEDELKDTLDFPTDKKSLLTAVSRLDQDIHKMHGVTLEDISGLFVSAKLRNIDPDFESAADSLSVELNSVATGKSISDYINAWAERGTNGRVTDVLPKNLFNAYISNAMYFKANWGFDNSLTEKRLFSVNYLTSVNVTTLKSTGSYQYGNSEEYDAKFLVLPNVRVANGGKGAKAVFILPNKQEGLSDVMDAIGDGRNLRAYMNSLPQANVTLRAPEFSVDSTVDLKKIIPKFGITNIFRKGRSDLTRILVNESGKTPVITQGVQKVIFQFKGSKNSDVTEKPVLTNVIDYNVDHPFAVIIIAHTKNNDGPITFNLRVYDPSK